MLLQEKPTLRLKTKVKFPNRRNSADYRVSLVFTSYGNMTVVSNSVVTETSRIHEFKECVSAKPQSRKSNVHTCFPLRLSEFPLAEIQDSVRNPLQKRIRKRLFSPCERHFGQLPSRQLSHLERERSWRWRVSVCLLFLDL